MQQAVNFALDNLVPGGDLVKIVLGRADAPQTLEAYLELAVNTALDFIPGGKVLKVFKGAASRLGIKKLEEQLLKQAKKRVGKEVKKKVKEVKKASTAKCQLKKKKSGLSGKESAKDLPSWAKEYRPRIGESGKDFAKKIMDAKYGPGQHKEGPKTEFNKIKTYIDQG